MGNPNAMLCDSNDSDVHHDTTDSDVRPNAIRYHPITHTNYGGVFDSASDGVTRDNTSRRKVVLASRNVFSEYVVKVMNMLNDKLLKARGCVENMRFQ